MTHSDGLDGLIKVEQYSLPDVGLSSYLVGMMHYNLNQFYFVSTDHEFVEEERYH